MVTVHPTIRIIVPDQFFDDNKLMNLIPKADDKIYETYKIKIGSLILDKSNFGNPGYLENRISCLKLDSRIPDAIAALQDADVDVVCCVTTGDDSNIAFNSLDPFQKFLDRIHAEKNSISKAKSLRILGYGRSDTLFQTIKTQCPLSNHQFNLYAVNPANSDLGTLISTVGNVKRLALSIQEALKALFATKNLLVDDITLLESEFEKLNQQLLTIKAEIVSLKLELAQSPAKKEDIKNKIALLEKEHHEISDSGLKLNKSIRKLETKKSDIEKEIKKLEKKIQQSIKQANEDINYVEKIGLDADYINEKTNKIQNKLNNQIEKSNKVKSDLQSEKVNIESELTATIEKMISSETKIKGLLKEHADATEKLQKLEAKTNILAATLNSYEATKNTLKTKMKHVLQKIKEHSIKLKGIQKRIEIKKMDPKKLNITDPTLKQKILDVINTSKDGEKKQVKVKFPSSLPANNASIKEIINVLIAFPEHFEEIEIGEVVKQEIEGFAEFLSQPDLALVSLNLSKANLRDEDVEPLLKALASNPANLKTLKLDHNELRQNSAKLLSQFLKASTAIQTLDLHDNDLGDVGVQELAEGIQSNQSLSSFDLRNNNMSPIGIQGLAVAMVTHGKPWDNWYISGNLGGDGVLALTPLLLHDTMNQATYSYQDTLRLSLNGWKLDDGAIEYLCTILKQRSSLIGINLVLYYLSADKFPNQFGKQGLLKLGDVAKNKPGLIKSLNVGWTLTADGAEYFPQFYQQFVHHMDIEMQGVSLNAVRLKSILPTMSSKNLKRIDLSSNYGLGVAGWYTLSNYLLQEDLAFFNQLTNLSLDRTSCTSLDPLVTLLSSGHAVNLSSLSIANNPIPDSEFKKLASVLPSATKLTYLSMYGTPLALEGLKALLTQIEQLDPSGRKIYLTIGEGCALQVADVETIAQLFPSKLLKNCLSFWGDGQVIARLRFLLENEFIKASGICNRSSAYLHDDLVEEFIKGLESSHFPLKQLNLHNNQLTSVGIEKLIKLYFLKDDSRVAQLKVLNLSKNPLGDAVTGHLLNLFQHPKCALEEVYLDNTQMTPIGLNPLAGSLKDTVAISMTGNNLQGLFKSTAGPTVKKKEVEFIIKKK